MFELCIIMESRLILVTFFFISIGKIEIKYLYPWYTKYIGGI